MSQLLIQRFKLRAHYPITSTFLQQHENQKGNNQVHRHRPEEQCTPDVFVVASSLNTYASNKSNEEGRQQAD
jgi:hypothetical protein